MYKGKQKGLPIRYVICPILLIVCFFVGIGSIGWRMDYLEKESYKRSDMVDALVIIEQKRAELLLLDRQYREWFKHGSADTVYGVWDCKDLYMCLQRYGLEAFITKLDSYQSQLIEVTKLCNDENYTEAQVLYDSKEYIEARSALMTDCESLSDYIQLQLKQDISLVKYDAILWISAIGFVIFACLSIR